MFLAIFLHSEEKSCNFACDKRKCFKSHEVTKVFSGMAEEDGVGRGARAAGDGFVRQAAAGGEVRRRVGDSGRHGSAHGRGAAAGNTREATGAQPALLGVRHAGHHRDGASGQG